MTEKAGRFFDEEDFTSEHDEMMLDLMNNWKDYILSERQKRQGFKAEGDFEGEPILNGYPPVFPDAIIRHAWMGADHHSEPILTKGSLRDAGGLYYVCSLCGCEKRYGNQYEKEDPCTFHQRDIIIEIKPKIESFGKVLRQLRIYGSRLPGADIILLTKDSRFDEPFKKENIRVVHPTVNECPR